MSGAQPVDLLSVIPPHDASDLAADTGQRHSCISFYFAPQVFG